MAYDFETQELRAFLSKLGAKTGAPGGGAAAALTGATGAALVEMVARFNDAKHKKSSGTASRAQKLRQELQRLMKKDAEAFHGIQALYKVRAQKKAAWKKALEYGAKVPTEICEKCREAAKLALREKKRTSSWLMSDLKESEILLDAAWRSARLNVEINLKELKKCQRAS